MKMENIEKFSLVVVSFTDGTNGLYILPESKYITEGRHVTVEGRPDEGIVVAHDRFYMEHTYSQDEFKMLTALNGSDDIKKVLDIVTRERVEWKEETEDVQHS
jgi:hypothetical protein